MKILRSVIFMGGLIGILVLISFGVKPVHDVYNVVAVEQKKDAISGEEDNTIDVLYGGDSECYSSFNPKYIWDEYGYSSYNCGIAASRLCDTYELLRYSFETQSPKVVFLETNCFFRYAGIEKDPDEKVMNLAGKILPVLKYHSRWENYLDEKVFVADEDEKREIELKGFVLRTAVKPYENGNYVEETETVKKIAELAQDYILKIKDLCDENGADLILISVPSPENWTYKKHNGVQKFADKNDFTYIDLNIDDAVKIDWKKDTKDGGNHLNYYGAKKVSKYIGDYLKENYNLTDHRDDESYSDWNDMEY